MLLSINIIVTLFLNALYAFPIYDDLENDWNPFRGSRQVPGLPFHDFFHPMLANPYPISPITPILEQSNNAIQISNENESEVISAIDSSNEGIETTTTVLPITTTGILKAAKDDTISKTNLALAQHRSGSQQKINAKLDTIDEKRA